MKLSFKELWLEDFKSFAGAHNFPFDSFRHGLHFIGGNNKLEPRLGPNGAGKSALMVDAITWCLFGKTPSSLRNPDIKPWQGRGQTLVRLAVAIDDERLTFERTASPNSFKLDDKAAADDAFTELTGLNFDLFCNTVVMGQGQPLFFDLPPRGKMQLFVDVLELDKWDARSEAANTRVREIEQEHAQADGELMGLTGQRRQTDDLLKTATKQAAKWDEEHLEIIRVTGRMIAGANERYTSYKALADAADLAWESAALDLPTLRNEFIAHRDEANKWLTEIARLDERRAGKQNDVVRLKGELKAFGGDNCPVCGEPIRKGSKIAKHKLELVERIDELGAEIATMTAEAFMKKVIAAQRKQETVRKQVIEREKRLAEADAERRLQTPRASNELWKIGQYEQDLVKFTKQVNPHQEQISKLTRERTKLADRDKELRDELEILARAIERNKFWVKGFKDIRLLVIEDVLQELELTCNTMLAELGLVDWKISYAIERETKAGTTARGLNVSILSPKSRDAVKWELWSGGEGQRLRMVGALALSEVLLDHAGIQPDFEVLDEPTRHLSAEGVRDLCDFLAVRAEQLERRTMYIDHMAVESAQFASITTIEKDANGSHILRTA